MASGSRWRDPHRTNALGRVDSAIAGPGEVEWPGTGLTVLPSPHLSLFCTGECPLLVRSFLCFFLAPECEWCKEMLSAGEMLHTKAEVLDAKLEWFRSYWSEGGFQEDSLQPNVCPF